MSNTAIMNDHNAQLHLKREERLKDLLEVIINSPNGMSVKEMGAALKTSADSARLYVKDLLERNLIAVSHQEGKTRVYKAVDPASVKPIEEEAPKEDVMPVGHSGKEFEPGSYIPCGDTCKPGDVVWASSRSGEGAFFRYLVITPWEHKAMVLGIFEEGHPKLNLNDPYYVYIGDDPEKGVKLYADIRNNCQRGYRQFGERAMHVNQDLFDDVKSRLARSMGIDHCKDRSVVIDRLRNASDKQKEQMAKLREENERLKQDLKNSYIHQDEYKKAADDATELNRQLSDENDTLQKKCLQADASCADLQDKIAVTNMIADNLKKENADLRQQLSDISSKDIAVIQPRYDDDTVMGMIIDSEVKKTKIEVYEEQIKMLRQMVFSMIKGGASNG